MKIEEVIRILKRGGVGVIPTDTMYGLVARAFSKNAIERLNKIKERPKNKPFITLIASPADLKKFQIKPSRRELKLLEKVWPGPVSVVLSGRAFRMPKRKALIEILKKTGPLAAPSANPAGKKPASSIPQARKYFRHSIDFYLAGGKLEGLPSTLIEMRNGKIKVLRRGATLPTQLQRL